MIPDRNPIYLLTLWITSLIPLIIGALILPEETDQFDLLEWAYFVIFIISATLGTGYLFLMMLTMQYKLVEGEATPK